MAKKYYFINENIFTFNSGTEESAMNRQKLFRQQGLDSKIITRNFNPSFHQELKRHNLKESDVLNMYDFFQDTVNVAHHHNYLRYAPVVDKNLDKIDGVDNNHSLIKREGQTMSKVNIFPMTVGEVGTIEYYDRFENISSMDVYDGRGFKSKTQYLHPDGNIGHEILFDAKGNPKIEISHMNIQGHLFPTMFKLINYHGMDLRFNTEDDLFRFFLEQIGDKQSTVLINDRPNLSNVVASVENATQKFQYLHNEQTTNANLAGSPKGKLYPILEDLFHKHLNDFDGLIVSTKAQQKDLQKLYPEIQTYQIYDTALFSATEAKIKKSLPKRTKPNVVYVGRLFKDKHIEQLIQIISFAKNKVPDIHLDLIGYFESTDYQTQINDLINKLNVSDNVKIQGYRLEKDKQKFLKHAKVMLQTSFGEGLSMSLVEGLEYGIPEVAYDVNYGPNEIIKSDYNGYLINPGNVKKAADHVANILTDTQKFNTLSQNALTQAHQFDAEHVAEQWRQITD